MVENKKILINEMLTADNIINTNYGFCHSPNVVGIAKNGSRYYVYSTNNCGSINFLTETQTFQDALLFARKMYKEKAFEGVKKLEKSMNI